jgi:hypothetical protein
MRTVILLFTATLLAAQEPSPTGTIAGTITDQSGNPASQMRVKAVAYEAGQTPKVLGEAQTNSQGRYSMKVTPGRVVLLASRSGNSVTIRYVKDGDSERPEPFIIGALAGETAPIQVAPGTTLEKVDFQVRPPQGYGEIQGFRARYDPN